MTPADQKFLQEIRRDTEALAKKMGEAHTKGYTISFGVNSEKGEITAFDVKAAIDIDRAIN